MARSGGAPGEAPRPGRSPRPRKGDSMNAKDAIRTVMNSSEHVVSAYLSDLSDADLLVRPAPGANHIAWQLGHLIASEQWLLTKVPGAQLPELPAGFAEAHGKDRTKADGPD